MKRFTTNTTQSLKIIPRGIFELADVSITDEFTQIETNLKATGTYFGGFWTTNFTFTPINKRTYKIEISVNGVVQWKGKAFAEEITGARVLLINGRALLITNRALII